MRADDRVYENCLIRIKADMADTSIRCDVLILFAYRVTQPLNLYFTCLSCELCPGDVLTFERVQSVKKSHGIRNSKNRGRCPRVCQPWM